MEFHKNIVEGLDLSKPYLCVPVFVHNMNKCSYFFSELLRQWSVFCDNPGLHRVSIGCTTWCDCDCELRVWDIGVTACRRYDDSQWVSYPWNVTCICNRLRIHPRTRFVVDSDHIRSRTYFERATKYLACKSGFLRDASPRSGCQSQSEISRKIIRSCEEQNYK